MYKIEELDNENPLLNQVIIKNDTLNFQSSIYPNLGASLQKLSFSDVDIIDGIENNNIGLNTYRSKFNSSLLFPFPNRISNGKYTFKTVNYKLACNETALNNTLHGFVYNKSFKVKNTEVSKEIASVIFSYTDEGKSKGFPFSYQLDVTYTFTKEKMSVNFTVFNNGDKSFPFGIGWHPYFKTSNLGESILNFNADNQYSLDEKMIPQNEIPLKFKTPLLLKDMFLDDCFITKQSTSSLKTNNYAIEIDFSSKTPNSFLQVYTPPTRDSIAIEPMTCAPNSFNNKNGLLVLEPKKSYDWKIDMKYSF
ncbi:aldose 1-epimerase [Lutibacter sp. B1]|uniref:aldose 1-epimerase n=1 Tax=Lutibacter sp. B1 TaxID=2725996 RepID=UPI00145743E5|nr:aldose 1-epimerase [Lutibacter sp. B1]NLP58236.1 aldose 1-epimerase [Lutibacter sp. B1]